MNAAGPNRNQPTFHSRISSLPGDRQMSMNPSLWQALLKRVTILVAAIAVLAAMTAQTISAAPADHPRHRAGVSAHGPAAVLAQNHDCHAMARHSPATCSQTPYCTGVPALDVPGGGPLVATLEGTAVTYPEERSHLAGLTVAPEDAPPIALA